jgi:Uma2 family endonuclease
VIGVGPAFDVRPGLPFAADDWSEPEPDLAVCRRDPRSREHPSQVALLVQVSDSSLRRDRGIKLGIYAEAGVPEYWIVDVKACAIEVYTQPTRKGYAHVEVLREGDVLRPRQLPGVELPIANLPRE